MKTILVIEDKTEVRENLVEILTLAQYTVLAAIDGKQGVALARTGQIDLILCDIMMPELDGYGVLHILGKDPATQSIPFIFLTAKIDPAQFRNGMSLGADDYLTKPVDDITLLNAIELRLKKSGQPRQPPEGSALTSFLAILQPVPVDQPATSSYPSMYYPRKQFLYLAGNVPSALYYIRRGQVKLFQADAFGNTLITGLAGAGAFVGYAALLASVVYPESAQVLADADICVIAKEDWLTLCQQHPDIARFFADRLALDLLQREERLLKLAYQSVRKRVAEALLLVQRTVYPGGDLPSDLVTPDTAGSTRGPLPPLTFSRETWSQLVGASTETVIRVLSDMRAEGLIQLTGNQITLLEVDKLAQLKR